VITSRARSPRVERGECSRCPMIPTGPGPARWLSGVRPIRFAGWRLGVPHVGSITPGRSARRRDGRRSAGCTTIEFDRDLGRVAASLISVIWRHLPRPGSAGPLTGAVQGALAKACPCAPGWRQQHHAAGLPWHNTELQRRALTPMRTGVSACKSAVDQRQPGARTSG
jgi:hypothetical protein